MKELIDFVIGSCKSDGFHYCNLIFDDNTTKEFLSNDSQQAAARLALDYVNKNEILVSE